MLTLAYLTISAIPTQAAKADRDPLDPLDGVLMEDFESLMPGKSFALQKPFLENPRRVNLAYPWTADLVQKMRQKDEELKLTGLNLSGFEGKGPNELAWCLRVSDGYYHLVPQDYPVDLDRIHGRCTLKPGEKWELCPAFNKDDPERINRNRFNKWGPYYIRQTRNEKGDLITNIIARSFDFMDSSKINWKYFTFGVNDYKLKTVDVWIKGADDDWNLYEPDTNSRPSINDVRVAAKKEKNPYEPFKCEGKIYKLIAGKLARTVDGKLVEGNYAQLHANRIKETLTGIDSLHNHPENTTLRLSPGEPATTEYARKLGKVENKDKQLNIRHLVKKYRVTDPRLKEFFMNERWNAAVHKKKRRRLLSRDEERVRKHASLRKIYADE